tara:strand:- start:1102 stop:1785 length:684 start_codon:yes stop_codon:yes gene_type:complete
MFSALTKGIRQLSDPATRQVVWLSIGIAALTFLAMFACIETALLHTSIFQTGWMETVSDILGRLSGVILAWLLFPAAISAAVGLFLGRVSGAVEARHYPALPLVEEPPFIDSLLAAGKFLLILVALNLALLFFIFTGPLYLILYYLVNGYLISREFFELVSIRRMDASAARAVRKRFQASLLIIGAIFAFLMTVPIVNLLTPIIATATMVHLFENWRARDGGTLVTT